MKKKVALLFGGNSPEHDVSIKSAKSIYDNIDVNCFKIVPIYVSKDHRFYISPNCVVKLTDEIENIVSYLKKYDIVFPIIHGNYGEDGKLQGFLDFFNIPYVGCKTSASAICMDKVITKKLVEQENIPVVPYKVVLGKYKVKEIEQLGYPLIVKPASGGSSIGIAKANNRKELKTAIKQAKQYDSKILIEKFLNIRELECAVLEEKDLYATDIGEIFPSNEFYDYNAKYENASNTTVSADLDILVKEQIRKYAKKIFKILNCKTYARIDFFYDGEDIYFNEINTIPGFTNISMYPKLMEEKYSYQKLIAKLLK